MKKQRKKSERKTTATKTETAQSRIAPMNSTAPSAISAFCAASALTMYISRIGVYLRSLWSRLERRLRDLQVRWRIKWSIAWMRRHSLNLALIVTTIALILFLGFISWLHLTSTHNIAIKSARDAYFEQLNKEQSTDAAKRAWKRLQSKHGYPAGVIYEPGKAPYYINKIGQRCRFV